MSGQQQHDMDDFPDPTTIDEEIGIGEKTAWFPTSFPPTSTNTTFVEDDEDDSFEDVIPVRVTCEICSDEAPAPAYCSGTIPHIFCQECFCGYARAEFDPLGAFEGERRCTMKGGSGGEEAEELVSYPGELPCPKFVLGECNCGKIPATMIARILSSDEEVLEYYEQAKRRLITAEEERNRQNDVEAQAHAEPTTELDRLRADVHEALSLGAHVACPDCNIHGQKNDACMHMTCPCGTRYCYCCGRRRGESAGECPPSHTGNGCDASHIYLQDYDGWGGLAMGDETAGEGALHEFHKCRMIFFLNQVKSKYPEQVWRTLRDGSPEILQDVPTPGRSIGWNEIDGAGPPLFGGTDVQQLRWKDDGLNIRNDTDQESNTSNAVQDDDNSSVDSKDEDVFVAWVESFQDKQFVTMWCIALAVVIVLLSLRAISDNKAIRVLGGLGSVVLATTGLPILMSKAIDSWAEGRNEYSIQPFFGGRHRALPFLATGGKWNQYRMMYWVGFFGGISLSSLIISNSDNDFSRAVGIGILFASFLFYSAGIVIVNQAPEPPDYLESVRSKYRSALGRLWAYGALISLGVTLVVAFDGTSMGNNIGKCCLTLGFAGIASEITSRLSFVEYGAHDYRYSLYQAQDVSRLCLSYLFFGGIALGSLMVGLGNNDGSMISKLRLVGVFTILFSILGSILWYMRCTRPRP